MWLTLFMVVLHVRVRESIMWQMCWSCDPDDSCLTWGPTFCLVESICTSALKFILLIVRWCWMILQFVRSFNLLFGTGWISKIWSSHIPRWANLLVTYSILHSSHCSSGMSRMWVWRKEYILGDHDVFQ